MNGLIPFLVGLMTMVGCAGCGATSRHERRVPDVLELRLHLRSEVKVERYRLAQVPSVCPDRR
jgi:hypothetical protein